MGIVHASDHDHSPRLGVTAPSQHSNVNSVGVEHFWCQVVPRCTDRSDRVHLTLHQMPSPSQVRLQERERDIYIFIYLFISHLFIYLLIHLFKYNICVYHLSYVTLSHDVTCSHTWSFRISPPRIGSVTRHPDSQAKQQEQMILITCFQWLKKIHLTEVVTAGGKGGACGSTPKYSQQ